MPDKSDTPTPATPSTPSASSPQRGARQTYYYAVLGLGLIAIAGLSFFFLGRRDQVYPIDQRLVESVISCAGTVATEKGVKLDAAALRERMTEKSGAALSTGVRVEAVVHTELLEKLAQSDRLEGLRLYQTCIKEREHASPQALLDAISKTEDVWNLYDSEVIRTHGRLPPSKADEAVAAGRQFDALDDAGLTLKEKIVKYDRKALMYLIATEILVAAGDSASIEKARQTAVQGVSSARTGRALLQQGLVSPTPEFTAWIQAKKMNTTTAERLMETAAQAHSLNSTDELEAEVRSALDSLPCDYVVARKLGEEAPIKRYSPKLERLAECANSAPKP